MVSTTRRTFESDDGEAVQLPRQMAFGADVELRLVKSGDVPTIYPTRPSPAALVDRLALLPRPVTIETRDDDLA